MFKFKNFLENENTKVIAKKEGMRVIEYQTDLSVSPMYATTAYFDLEKCSWRSFRWENLIAVF